MCPQRPPPAPHRAAASILLLTVESDPGGVGAALGRFGNPCSRTTEVGGPIAQPANEIFHPLTPVSGPRMAMWHQQVQPEIPVSLTLWEEVSSSTGWELDSDKFWNARGWEPWVPMTLLPVPRIWGSEEAALGFLT